MNFPSSHPLFRLDRDVLRDADLVLFLDVRDQHGTLCETDHDARPTGRTRVEPGCRLVSIDLGELEMSSWTNSTQRFMEVDLAVLGDTRDALPRLVDLLRSRAGDALPGSSVAERDSRMAALRVEHAERRAAWLEKARGGGATVPMSPARMVLEVGEAIKEYDWVLTANTVKDWARRLWDVDQPHRHPGKHLGTATQIGISLGVALAHKGSGRLVVDLQPDGDLLYDASALWVAAHHQIPLLVVMYNNRAYHNSWDHQTRMAAYRGRGGDGIEIGTALDDPAPDFAGLARSFGWYAEGPISDAEALAGALERAIAVVQREGRPALVDAVTLPR